MNDIQKRNQMSNANQIKARAAQVIDELIADGAEAVVYMGGTDVMVISSKDEAHATGSRALPFLESLVGEQMGVRAMETAIRESINEFAVFLPVTKVGIQRVVKFSSAARHG